MTAGDRRKVESAFDSLAAGQTPTQHPRPAGKATYGQRWEDIDAAVRYACDETEMAVVGSSAVTSGNNTRDIIGWEFRLRTVEDWPGILKIKRVALDAKTTSAQRVYEAQAEIGAFGDRTDRAIALLDALDKQLTAFGRKPRLAE